MKLQQQGTRKDARKTVLLISGKNKDVMFAVDFMRNWFWGDTKLSETSERELKKVYNHLF